MKCTYHPDTDAVGVCVNCGRLICAECKTVLGGKNYCKPCAEKLFTSASIPQKAKGASWFKRHLNWTYIFALLCVGAVAGIVALSAGFCEDRNYLVMWWVFSILFIVVLVIGYVIATIWLLKQKRRSLFWLLCPIWPLYLENRSEVIDIRDGKLIRRRRDEND